MGVMDQRLACVVVAVIGLGLLGCTKKTNTTPNDGTAATGAGGSSSSTGGTGAGGTTTGVGTGGATGTGGMTGAVTVKNIPCGDTKCASTDTSMSGGMAAGGGMFMFAQVCCADAATSTCGTVAMADGSCQKPAMSDPRCPTAFGGAVAACCVNNLCGIDGSLQGRGCVDLGALAAMFGNIPAQFRAMFMFPDPRTCDGTPLPGAGEDGGTAGTSGTGASGTGASGTGASGTSGH
jgi:hypothetical protein